MSSLPFFKTIFIFIFAIFFSLKSIAQEGSVSIEQDAKIERLLTERKRLLRNGELKTHYCIQVVSGSDLNNVRAILKTCKSKFPDFKSDIQYETPNYKVWVGEFRNRLDADRALLIISEDFEGAFVLKPKGKKK